MSEHNGRSWTEYFRVITPFLLLVITFIGGNINNRLADIENKIFRHLTNDEIHTPRTVVVEKGEFDLYQKMRDKQMDSMMDMIAEIKVLIKDHNKK
jgi:hypothetical protein